jgi:hypothetical protein
MIEVVAVLCVFNIVTSIYILNQVNKIEDKVNEMKEVLKK